MRLTLRGRITDWLHNQPRWAHHLRGHLIVTRRYGGMANSVDVCSCGDRWANR